MAASRTLPAATWAAVKAVGEATGATEFMLCQAAGAVTLAALGAGDDIAIGAAVANRIAEATDELVGLFANVVVLRTNLSGEPALREAIERSLAVKIDERPQSTQEVMALLSQVSVAPQAAPAPETSERKQEQDEKAPATSAGERPTPTPVAAQPVAVVATSEVPTRYISSRSR